MAVMISRSAIINLCKEIEMTNTILLLTHGHVGKAMLDAASNTLGKSLPDIICVSVEANPDPDKLFNRLSDLIAKQVNKHLLILIHCVILLLFPYQPPPLAQTHRQFHNRSFLKQ